MNTPSSLKSFPFFQNTSDAVRLWKALLRAVAVAALAGASVLFPQSAFAQAFTFTSGSLTYNENFDSMGTNSPPSYVPGWTAVKAAGSSTTVTNGQTLVPVVTDGSAISGAAYSVGTAASTDRAFGTLASGTIIPRLGASFVNNTGGRITNITLSGVMEQWRSSSRSDINEVITNEYSFDATSLTNGTWTGLPSMNLLEKLTALTDNVAKDGNNAANKTSINGTISSINWPNGTTMWIRWNDADNTGSDGLYAIDDFSMTVQFTTTTAPTGTGAASPSTLLPDDNTVLTVTVTPGTMPDSTGLAVTVDLSSIGGSSTQAFFDDGSNGDTNTADNVFTFATTVDAGTAPGAKSLPFTITDAQSRSGSGNISLTVSTPDPPVITNQPQSKTVFENATVSFTVGASGFAPLTYQWRFNGTNLPGATSSTLTLNNVSNANAGPYQAVVNNNFGAVTSTVATLTVNSAIATNIAYLRTLQDQVNWLPNDTTNFYRVDGTVTTYTNLTTSGNALFYIQDATAGISVFVSGSSTIRPAAGDLVRVTGPLGHFNGLLEFNLLASNPTHGVSTLSTGNALPDPTLLNFSDTNNIPLTETNLEARLLVVSNVFLDLTTPNFPSAAAGGNVTLTNSTGELFTLRVDARVTDITSQPKPRFALAIIGVLAQSDTSDPRTSGYQILPSRRADIITDTVSPVAHCPGNISVTTTSVGGATVTFTATATDDTDPNPSIVCNPASGATFAPGTTAVTCTATDVSGNTNACSFTVTVNRAPTAANYNLGTRQNKPSVLSTSKLLLAASDADGDTLSVTAVSATSTNGGAVLWSGSTITYTPATNFIGADRFSFTISDGRGGDVTNDVVIAVADGALPTLNAISATFTGTSYIVRFAGIPGRTYELQRSPDQATWTAVANVTVPAKGIAQYEDVTNQSPAFYRAVAP